MEIRTVARPAEGPAFWAHVDAVLPIAGDAVDLGTGTGRVALHMAPKAHGVVGVDVDASSLEAARWDAKRRGIANVRFVQGDAESVDLVGLNEGRPFQLATARLFLSRSLIGRVAAALSPGGHFILEALEAAHWKEAGGSRFNLPASQVVADLERLGLAVRDVRIEVERHVLEDARAAEAHLKDRRLWTKWRADGRWERLRASIRGGDRGLTDALLVVWATRASG